MSGTAAEVGQRAEWHAVAIEMAATTVILPELYLLLSRPGVYVRDEQHDLTTNSNDAVAPLFAAVPPAEC